MKFRIISTMLVLVILFILYVLFSGSPSGVDENGMPVEPTAQQY